MNIVCIGGGPSGLYFGLLMKLQNSANNITVIERNRPYDTFGWGVVFSDATMQNLRIADLVSADEIYAAFNHWDNIDVHFKGKVVSSGGHGFIGIGRKKLLNILQKRCEQLGVNLVFETTITDDQEVAKQYNADLVIACDGLNSVVRTRYEKTLQPDIDLRKCRFVWLGTHKLFDAFTFAFVENKHGWFQAHAYRFDDNTSTFIVETPEEVWRASGLEEMSQEEAIAYCEQLFADQLEGHKLISNASHLRGSANWIKFPRVICKTWIHWNVLTTDDGESRDVPVVLMGDAAHTAHFSIGSGTKLALEDAIEMTRCIATANPEKKLNLTTAQLTEALNAYDKIRSVEVLKIQNAARNSTEWFENVARYAHLDPEQFAYSMLTRSQRISHENLKLRDQHYVERINGWLAKQAGLTHKADASSTPPMFTPYQLRGVQLKNRVVVSPMLTYSAQYGVANDFHLQHYGSRALGGAGLVMLEMTSVSPDGLATNGCLGLWNDRQETSLQRIVTFVKEKSVAKLAIQLGHAGPRGSTKKAWNGYNKPLPSGNWNLVSASSLPYIPRLSATPAELNEEKMQQLIQAFVASTESADRIGIDWVELQMGHGYLLNAFISPLTNKRTDQYGGTLENRMRFPLKVLSQMRAKLSDKKPISVRISAHDWVEGGITPDDAVEISKMLKANGADMITCSSGEVCPSLEKPIYGRMYQAPFADRVRNEAHIATMTVGGIFEADHVNSIIAAGRADLCAVGRPHLADASWTLQQAAKIGYSQMKWPDQYAIAQRQLESNFKRNA
jgi:anthraniloyl-CoA monooxygenase